MVERGPPEPAHGPPSRTVARIVLVACAVLAGLYAVFLVRQILILVVVSMFFAIGLDPLVQALRRLRLSRSLAVLVVFLGALVFVIGFFASVTPPLVRETQRLAQEVPDFARELATRSERFRELDQRYDIQERLQEGIGGLPELAARSAEGVLGIARSLGRAVFSILTVGILTAYFLLDLPNLLSGATRLMPEERRTRFRDVAGVVYRRISGYLIGQLTVSIIAGLSSLVVLSLLRVPYPLPLAMWVSISALIPMVGASLGAIPAVIVAFLTSATTGILTLAFFLIYQQVENYVIHPRIMRRAVDISAATVILAALIGATLFGLMGALLAIPVTATAKVLIQETWFSDRPPVVPSTAG